MIRRAPPALALLLVLPVALAGCLGGDEAPVDAASADAAASDAPAAAGGASPPAGAATGTAPSETPADDAGMGPALVDVPVLWNGKLPTHACAPMGPGACMSPIQLDRGDSSRFLDLPGAPQEASLTLSWASRGPHEDALRFLLLDVEGSPDSWSGRSIAQVEGTSPLALDVSGIDLPEGHRLVVAARAPSLTPSPVYAFAENGLEFAVEGSVSALVVPLH